MRNANDETVVFVDSCKADDEKRRSEVMEEIIVLNSEADSRPHNTAIISDNAQYHAEDKCICMSLSDAFYTPMTPIDEKEMCDALSLLMRYIIAEVCRDYGAYSDKLKKNIKCRIKNINKEDGFSNDDMSCYAIISEIVFVLRDILKIDVKELNAPDFLTAIFQRSNVIAETSSDVITSNFIEVLKSKIESDEISIMIHSKDMDFVSGEKQVVIKEDDKNDLMLIEESTITDSIMPAMKTTDSIIRLERALNDADLIHATKGLRFPCTIYNEGVSDRKEFIAIKLSEIVDSSLRIKIDIKAGEKWFSSDTTEPNMMPLAENHICYTLYRKFDFDAGDNMHCFITGESGSGKTFYMTEYIVSLHRATNQLTIVLDTSGSFSKERVIANLSAPRKEKKDSCEYSEKVKEEVCKYIDQNVEFCNVERDGVPVDILNFDFKLTDNEKRKKILDIVSVSIQNMGKRQRAELNKLIDSIIEEDDVSIIDLLELVMDEDTEMSDSLRMELEEILEPFCEYELNDISWGEYLKDRNGVIIITAPDSNQGGSAFVDMILMSLYYYQCNNCERHINIVIDEIQNQNCNKGSAIEKILREGRKYHMGLTYATQYLSGSNKDKQRMMNGAGMKVYFKPDSISAKSIAREIEVRATKLTSLKKGECYIKGTMFNNIEQANDSGMVRCRTYRNFVK